MRKQKNKNIRSKLTAWILAVGLLLMGLPLTVQTTKADNTITVTFRLIGSTLSERISIGTRTVGNINLASGSGYMGAEYVTWIPTRTYTLPADSTVYDLFVKATADAGIASSGADNNYVTSIQAPAVCGGYALSEFSNGNFSGWMYTINGKHPGVGLKNQKLNSGDQVIWHYVDDYRCEEGDRSDSDTQYAQYWNAWLKAADTAPTAVTGNTGNQNTGNQNTGNTSVAASTIKLNKSSASLYLKSTLQLKATVSPTNAAEKPVWTSSSKKVASVDQNGKVTALKKGTATITATLANGKKATCKITVKTIPSTKVRLNVSKKTLKKGKTVTLKAVMTPKKSTDSLTWSSSNKRVAKVDKNGKVTALRKGTATITVKTTSGKKAVCRITVK